MKNQSRFNSLARNVLIPTAALGGFAIVASSYTNPDASAPTPPAVEVVAPNPVAELAPLQIGSGNSLDIPSQAVRNGNGAYLPTNPPGNGLIR